MMKLIDKLLNGITMYRLVVYGLFTLALTGVAFAALGKLHFSPIGMAVSFAILLVSNYMTDVSLGNIWHVARNSESWLITTLILFLILSPPKTLGQGLLLATAGVMASASKFILAYRGKHLLNPAAFAASVLGLTALMPASWWVGSSSLWPYSLLLGLAVVRKIRRFQLVLTFLSVAIVLQLVLFVMHGQPVVSSMQHALLSSPLIFLSTIMLTEPATMPARKRQQLIFGAGIAVLYVMAWHIGPLYIYPEVALLIGNIFAYAVSPKYRLWLQLKEAQKISDRVYNYVFVPDRPFTFLPGQYMEWTLAGVPFDNRGNRRTFTIASSPTEQTVQVGVKFYEPTSMYKYVLSNLQPGDSIFASQLAGNFTLNGNETKKLVFIAGGIGITPFCSMVKYIIDNRIAADITILYVVSDPSELAYRDVFLAGAKHGVRLLAVTRRPGHNEPGLITAELDAELIGHLVPDYRERTFYISGPNAMVGTTQRDLTHLGVPRRHIKTDYFSGY